MVAWNVNENGTFAPDQEAHRHSLEDEAARLRTHFESDAQMQRELITVRRRQARERIEARLQGRALAEADVERLFAEYDHCRAAHSPTVERTDAARAAIADQLDARLHSKRKARAEARRRCRGRHGQGQQLRWGGRERLGTGRGHGRWSVL